MNSETAVDSSVELSPIIKTQEGPWNPWLIVLVTLLFSILPGGILYALNFERLGVKDRKIPNLVTFILLFLVLFFLKLKNQHSPISVISLFISISCSVHFFKTQNPLYKKFIKNEYKRGSFLIPFFVILISVALILSIVFGLDTLAAKNYDKGVSLMQQGQYEKAKEIFEAYLKYDEEAYETYFNLAIIYLETRRLDMAEISINEYLRHYPDDNEALGLLSEIESAR